MAAQGPNPGLRFRQREILGRSITEMRAGNTRLPAAMAAWSAANGQLQQNLLTYMNSILQTNPQITPELIGEYKNRPIVEGNSRGLYNRIIGPRLEAYMARNAARNAAATAAAARQQGQSAAALAEARALATAAAAERNTAQRELAQARAEAETALREARAAAAGELANAVAAESRAVTEREKANATRRINEAMRQEAVLRAEQTAAAAAAQQEAQQLRDEIDAAQAAARNGSAAHAAELERLQQEQAAALVAAQQQAAANLNAARREAAAAAKAAANANHSAAAERAAQTAAAALEQAQSNVAAARANVERAKTEKTARQVAAQTAYNKAKSEFNPRNININKARALVGASNLLLTFTLNGTTKTSVQTNRNAANTAIKNYLRVAKATSNQAVRNSAAAAKLAANAVAEARLVGSTAIQQAKAEAAAAEARAAAAEAAAAKKNENLAKAQTNKAGIERAMQEARAAHEAAAIASAEASKAANARVRAAEKAAQNATNQQARNKASKEAAEARAAAAEATANQRVAQARLNANGRLAANAARIRQLEQANWSGFKTTAKAFVNSLEPINKSQGLGKTLSNAQKNLNSATNKEQAKAAYIRAKAAWNARPLQPLTRGGAATTSFKTLLNNYSRATASKKFQEWKPIMNRLRANNKSSAQSEDKIAFGVFNKEFTKYNQLLTRVRNINARQRARNFERLNAAWKSGNAAGWRRSNLNKLQQAYLLYFNANGNPKGGAGGGGGGKNNGGVPPGYKNSGNKIYFSFEKNGRHVSGLKKVITDSRGIGYIYTSKHGPIPILTNKTTIQVRNENGTVKKNRPGYKLNLNRKANASSRTWAVIKAAGGPPARTPSGPLPSAPSNFAKTLMEATNKLHINANGKTPVKANNLQAAMSTRVSWSNNTTPNKIGGLGYVYVAKGPPTAYYIKKNGTNKFYPVVQAVAGIGGNRTRYVISTKNINNKNAPRGNPSILPK